MAFPRDPLGLRCFVQLGGQWVPVSPAPYTRAPIKHKRGRAYRANAADPSEASIMLRNRDGRWTPRYAEGPYYGVLTRNTPIKAVIPGGDSVHLELVGSGDRATTPSATALNVPGDLDARIDVALDGWVTGSEIELFGKYLPTGDQRSWQMSINPLGGLGLRASTTGGAVAQFTSAGPVPVPASGRATLRVTRVAATGLTTYYVGTSLNGPWTLLSSTTQASGALYASTAPLTIGDIDGLGFGAPAGRVYGAQLRNGIDGPVVADVDFTTQAQGATSVTDSAGRVWTLAGAALITDRVTRCQLEVPEWPTKWSTSERDAWTSIEAAGILRRLSQGKKPLDSTLRRRVPSGGPMAYWPMEDGETATQFYSPITGVRPLATSGMSLAADDSLAGSNALPTIKGGATLAGTIPGQPGVPSQWHTEFVFRVATDGPATPRTMLQWTGSGTVRRWRLMVKAGGAEIYGYDSDDTAIVSQPVSLSGTGVYGNWCRWRLWAVQNGGNVDWTVSWVPIGLQAGGNFTGSYAGSVGQITGVRSPDGGYSSDLDGVTIGHIAALPLAATAIYNSADTGFNGETAAARMQRLCAEETVPLQIVGVVSSTERLGPQQPATLLDLLREAAEADGGALGESQNGQLRYRTRVSLHNQPVKLTLDYGARKVSPPLEPVEDDQVRNEWTVSRGGGSSAVEPLETGPLSIADIGYYPDSKTLSLYSDEQAEHRAGWELHLSTWDEARWPAVTVRLHRHPELIPNVLSLDVGDKIRIDNLPRRFAGGGTVELLVDSWEESLLPRSWEITFNCSPAGPWDVAELAIVEDYEDTTYEVPWTSAGSLPWVRSSAQAHTGSWSLKSGAISNSQTSDAIIAVPPGRNELRFWYWTSSEAAGSGFAGDRLIVLVDGVQVLLAQGTTPWTQAIVDVTGASVVTFRYAKDSSTAVGSDSAHIDNVSFTGPGPTRLNTDGSKILTAVTASATQLVVGSAPGPHWTRDPGQLPFNVLASGEEMRATAVASWARDVFGRTAAGGWGASDTGQAWIVVGGAGASDFSVGSGYGAHLLGTVNVSRRAALDQVSPDADVVVSLTTSATATGGSLYGGPAARWADADNLIHARVEFTTGNAINLDIRKRAGAVESSIGTYASPLTHAAGTYVRCRLQVIGSVIRAKLWAAAAAEPDGWHVELVDTSLTASAFVGARSIAAASNTNVSPSVRYDDFEVLNPQVMTVVRSANGVVKAQSAGTPIGLAKPAYVAL